MRALQGNRYGVVPHEWAARLFWGAPVAAAPASSVSSAASSAASSASASPASAPARASSRTAVFDPATEAADRRVKQIIDSQFGRAVKG